MRCFRRRASSRARPWVWTSLRSKQWTTMGCVTSRRNASGCRRVRSGRTACAPGPRRPSTAGCSSASSGSSSPHTSARSTSRTSICGPSSPPLRISSPRCVPSAASSMRAGSSSSRRSWVPRWTSARPSASTSRTAALPPTRPARSRSRPGAAVPPSPRSSTRSYRYIVVKNSDSLSTFFFILRYKGIIGRPYF